MNYPRLRAGVRIGIRIGVCIGIMAAILSAACGRTRQVPIPETSQPYRVEREGTFPPVPNVNAQIPPDSAVQETATGFVAPPTVPVVEDLSPEVQRPAPGAAVPEWQPGFRVQVFAGLSLEIASDIAEDIESAGLGTAYVEFVEPYYKVRVGNCPAREDCASLQQRLRSAGHPSAWTVATGIRP